MTSDRVPDSAGPEGLIGAWKRFGPVGPAYLILGPGRPDRTGTPTMRVQIAETGEEVEVRLADIYADPVA